ncbi:ABC transporter ATP-binding protein [Cellulomonas sp. Leaf334]|uniref:ATP-binding cassette domain-containing protein n=1 Tax=Cellulomonas sp. Leaf334 TaxID=1736339 RepID=UPI0006F9B9F1|nr:ABC transporter ATP-binding protein [Cellulomonas sp. Leaf334]KQR16486.1 hypothetical protein ASF78_03665 [Cellulomonas sp. Leaf334]
MSRPERRLLWRAAREQRGPLALAGLGALVRQLGFLAVPACLGLAVDRGVEQGDLGAAAWWALALAGAGLVQVLGMCAWDQGSNVADARAGVRLRARLAGGLLSTDGPALPGDGDLVLRASRDVDAVRVWVHGLATWVVIGVTVAVLVPGIAQLDPALLLVVVATVPALVLLNTVYPRAYRKAGEAVAHAHGQRADVVEYVLRAALTSRGAGSGPALRATHRERSDEVTRHTLRAGALMAGWSALGEGVPRVALAVGVLVGVGAAADGRLSVGGLVAFSAWMGTVGVAVQVGLARVMQTVDARVGAARLVEVLRDVPDDVPDPAAPRVGLRARGVVAVPGAEPVDLHAVPGRLLVVGGPVGSGKSTLLRVLAGTAVPSAGEVTGGAVVLVPQRPLVLARTVRDNLALGAPIPDASLHAALQDVLLDDEVDLDTLVADGGASLSGGQLQRLALARALVSDAPVLLLDDVTSALDADTEAAVVAAILRESRRRTVVVASTRPAVLAAADATVLLGVGAGLGS